MRTFWYIVLCGLLLTPHLLTAQNYHYKHFTVDDGLPSSTVYSVMQDNKGFIWISTDAGVCRYDGQRFQTWTVKDGMPSNDILNMYEDKEGRVWFMPFKKDLSYFYNDSIYKFSQGGAFRETLVTSIIEDQKGNLWVSTTTKGLHIFEKNNPKDQQFAQSIIDHSSEICEDKKHKLWLGMEDKYAPLDSLQFANSVADSLIANGELVKLFFAANGKIYGYSGEYLYELNNGKAKVVYKNSNGGKNAVIILVNEDSEGNLLLATYSGAIKLDPNNPVKKVEYLNSTAVSDFFEDVEHNYWFTTLNKGLFFLNVAAKQVANYGVVNDAVAPLGKIIADSIHGHLYFSSVSGKLYYLDSAKLKNLEKPEQLRYGLLGNCINDSDYLICPCVYGLYLIKNGDLTAFKKKEAKLTDYFYQGKVQGHIPFDASYNVMGVSGVKTVAKDSNGVLWLASSIGIFEIKNGNTPNNRFIVTQHTEQRVVSMAIDKNGRFWVGTLEGLGIFDGNEHIEYPKGNNRKIEAIINDIKVDSNNVLWIATSGEGIYAYRDSILEHITEKEGLSSDVVNKITFYGTSMLLATNRGINRLELGMHSHVTNVYPLSINSGLGSQETHDVYQQGGNVYVTTNTGLSVFPAGGMMRDTTSPLIYIKSIKVNDLDTSIIKSYTLAYNQNSLRLEYIGLSYKSGKDILYRYKMEGLDTVWHEAQFTNIQYPTLPTGKYTFLVDARSLQGRWSGHPAMASFTILPPYWQTWWFRMLAGFLFLGIVAAISYAIIRYYRNRNEVARRLVQLEGQALRAQMNPHFIFNSLNAIHDFIADQDQRSAHLYLSRFAALIRRILELSRKPQVSLAEEMELLRLYIDLENMRFESKFEYEITVATDDNAADLFLPSMLIQPYVENAIRHGLMNKKEKGHLKLEVEQKGDKLVCKVTDNGIGRKVAAIMGGSNLKNHRSFAMDITKERMETIQENSKAGSQHKAEILIHDLVDNDGNPLGTMVELHIPLIK